MDIDPREDCYFFMTSSCNKGDLCSFRHNERALKSINVCETWLESQNCTTLGCGLKHSTYHIVTHQPASTNWNEKACYWETNGGCKKPNCPFQHSVPKQANPSNVYIRPGYTPPGYTAASALNYDAKPFTPQSQVSPQSQAKVSRAQENKEGKINQHVKKDDFKTQFQSNSNGQKSQQSGGQGYKNGGNQLNNSSNGQNSRQLNSNKGNSQQTRHQNGQAFNRQQHQNVQPPNNQQPQHHNGYVTNQQSRNQNSQSHNDPRSNSSNSNSNQARPAQQKSIFDRLSNHKKEIPGNNLSTNINSRLESRVGAIKANNPTKISLKMSHSNSTEGGSSNKVKIKTLKEILEEKARKLAESESKGATSEPETDARTKISKPQPQSSNSANPSPPKPAPAKIASQHTFSSAQKNPVSEKTTPSSSGGNKNTKRLAPSNSTLEDVAQAKKAKSVQASSTETKPLESDSFANIGGKDGIADLLGEEFNFDDMEDIPLDPKLDIMNIDLEAEFGEFL